MQTIITKACKELDIQPVPSQRVITSLFILNYTSSKTMLIQNEVHLKWRVSFSVQYYY